MERLVTAASCLLFYMQCKEDWHTWVEERERKRETEAQKDKEIEVGEQKESEGTRLG